MSNENRLVDIGGDRYVKASDIHSVKPLDSGSSIQVGTHVVTSDKAPTEIADQVNRKEK